jgi:hypothetical protein
MRPQRPSGAAQAVELLLAILMAQVEDEPHEDVEA